MKDVYSRLAKVASSDPPDYWQYFGARLASLAEIPDRAVLLDVGTGSGSVLIPGLQKIGNCGTGIGVDIYTGGFGNALSRIKKRNLMNTALVQMDANSLGFKDGLFDRVLSGFVGWDDCFDFEKLEFTGPVTRLAEMSRVLKMGGLLGISSWVKQDDLDWLGYQFQKHLPVYSAEQGIGSSWMPYSKENTSGLETILKEEKFQDIVITTEAEVFVSADEEEWWQQMRQAGWWVHVDKMASTDLDKLNRFKEQIFENLQEHRHDNGIHFMKTVLYAFGRKKSLLAG